MAEVKPTSAGELSKLASKIVTCKSGHAYRIRKMPLPVMAKFFSNTDMKPSTDPAVLKADIDEQMKDPMKIEKLITEMDDVLAECIVEPKVSKTELSSDTIINVVDIPMEDQFELFGIITEFAGNSIKKLTENESFRKKPPG